MRKLTSFRSFSLNSSQYDATDIFFSRPYTWPYTNDKYITLTKLYEKSSENSKHLCHGGSDQKGNQTLGGAR